MERRREEERGEKDGPGLVMVSSTLYPSVLILGSKNVYTRAEGIADHYWPWAVFFLVISLPSLSLLLCCLSLILVAPSYILKILNIVQVI